MFKIIIIIVTVIAFNSSSAQGVAVNNTGATPNTNAMFDVTSDDKGILIPRITTVSRTAMAIGMGATENGLLVYDKDLLVFYYWDGTQWTLIGTGTGSDNQDLTLSGNILSLTNDVTPVDLSVIKDHDWYEVGGTIQADAITDNIFTSGNVGIGTGVSPLTEKLEVVGSVKIADGTEGAGKVLTSDAAGKANWQYGGVPAGAVMAFNLATCPTGWDEADGTGGTPNLRGEFIRGLDNGRGIDVGRTLNSAQKGSLNFIEDGNQGGGISGAYSTNNNSSTQVLINNNSDLGYDNIVFAEYPLRPYYILSLSQTDFDRPLASGAGDTEWFDYSAHSYHTTPDYWGVSRPRNVALLYCVKQ